MACHPVGGVWAENTLERATRMGQEVLQRTASRQVCWPSEKEQGKNPIQDPLVYTTLDEAFASVLQYMSATTRQCKRFYKTSSQCKSQYDDLHCRRFHNAENVFKNKGNPLQRSEDVHIVVNPGTYAVSSGIWGTGQQQTHVVHVKDGNSVNVDFVL
ncbi:uncharacterized protein LOC121372022 [Gigantopelta aegis]|uniref:uncharacterized protein LOC121372022 n=1 Tax=Gigantopelta aegis TaxID=1735272 RepID=UPI001B88AEF0|nr:uncharacterized protein LOC121372022 [Gigantopelta aegis]